MEKRYNGKAIYQPKGKAAEYSPWACNFFTGCSNDCSYCYCKRGVLNHHWSTKPKLKKSFKDEGHAIEVFNKELDFILANYPKIKDQGLLFSFTTDPLLPETRSLTLRCAQIANEKDIPVKILTKRADFIDDVKFLYLDTKLTAFGFTLTGFDEEEPGASPNFDRMDAMRELHSLGFHTFASIEPVIVPQASRNFIESTKNFCDLFMVGLISGKSKDFYEVGSVANLWVRLIDLSYMGYKIYPKDSLLKYMEEDRLLLKGHFVNSDYNIFSHE